MPKIEWTGRTWNPTTGCSHASIECEECYAEKDTNRKKHNPKLTKYKAGFDVVVEHPKTLLQPFTWKEPSVVFVNSMSDIFHDDISPEFIQKVFEVMNHTPEHIYQILTKRHHRLEELSDSLTWTDNIWAGVSVGIDTMKRRIKCLQNCGAKHKFISFEPLLEEINDLDLNGINWAIVGGESGSARPMKKEWVLKIKEACNSQSVPFFFKQWGEERNNPDPNDPTMNPEHRYYSKGGCMLDGKIYRINPCIPDYTIPVISLFGEEYYVMDDYFGLTTIWELKSHLPSMKDELYDQLKENIKKNGINDPILYYITPEGIKLVVEGHTRLKAAIDLKLKDFPTKEIRERFSSLDEIILWMIKHQFQRRNLSSVERLKLTSLSRTIIEKIAKENLVKAGKKNHIEQHIDTDAEIARIAGVSKSTATRYHSVIINASPSIIDKMHKGEISISYAAKKIDPTTVVPKKSPPVKKKAEPEIHYVHSVDEGKGLITTGVIEAIMIVKTSAQIEFSNKKHRSKIGYYLLNEEIDSLSSNE